MCFRGFHWRLYSSILMDAHAWAWLRWLKCQRFKKCTWCATGVGSSYSESLQARKVVFYIKYLCVSSSEAQTYIGCILGNILILKSPVGGFFCEDTSCMWTHVKWMKRFSVLLFKAEGFTELFQEFFVNHRDLCIGLVWLGYSGLIVWRNDLVHWIRQSCERDLFQRLPFWSYSLRCPWELLVVVVESSWRRVG